MKKFKLIYSLAFALVIMAGCAKEDGIDKDLSFLSTAASSNNSKIFDISNDNSGLVKITPIGEGISSFTVNYGHGTGSSASAVVTPGKSTTHNYPEGSYTVTIVAKDIAGHETTATYPLQLTYRVPENLAITANTDGYKAIVSATALYANSFLVYYGDVANETGTPMAVGQILPAHIYPPSAAGTYKLKVVAKSGGAATTTKTIGLLGLPLTFEDVDQDYGRFFTFGNVNLSVVANPSSTGLNTSAKVLKYTKGVGAETWSGGGTHVDLPVDFALGKKIKLLFYSAETAKSMNFELEWVVGGTPSNGVAVLKVPNTVANQWQELTFDYSSIAAIPATAQFTQIIFRYNDSAAGTGEVFYIDNIRFTN